jgi:hypothetical protein
MGKSFDNTLKAMPRWCDYGPNQYVPINPHGLTPEGYHEFPSTDQSAEHTLTIRRFARYLLKHRERGVPAGSRGIPYCSMDYLGQRYTLTVDNNLYGAHIILHTEEWDAQMHFSLPKYMRQIKTFTGKIVDFSPTRLLALETIEAELKRGTRFAPLYVVNAFWYLSFGDNNYKRSPLRGSKSKFEKDMVSLKLFDDFQNWEPKEL